MTWRAVIALAVAVLAPTRVGAEEAVPAEVADIAILDKPGSQVPLDIVLKDGDGRAVKLESYFDGKGPVIVVMAYFRCPMLCSLVANGLTNGLKDVTWDVGKQFKVLVVSFDPRDTVAIAHDKRENYLKEYGRPVPQGGFEFLVGEAPAVKRLADALGFRYRWDEKSQQYAHAAGAFVLTPDGKVSRTLTGISFPGRDLRLSLLEASEGKFGSAWDQVVLYCFHYDSSARGYVIAARRLMRIGGVLSVLALGLLLFKLLRGSKPDEPAAPKKAA